MKLINNTVSKVSIDKPGVSISLLPGDDTVINEEQRRTIQPYITEFNLTVEKDKMTKKALPKIETIVVEEEDEEDVLDGGISVSGESVTSQKYSEKVLKDMTAAQLRELCKKEALLASGTRPQLIERLVGTTEEEV